VPQGALALFTRLDWNLLPILNQLGTSKKPKKKENWNHAEHLSAFVAKMIHQNKKNKNGQQDGMCVNKKRNR